MERSEKVEECEKGRVKIFEKKLKKGDLLVRSSGDFGPGET